MQCEHLATNCIALASQLVNAVCCFGTLPCRDSVVERVFHVEKSARFSQGTPELGRVPAMHDAR
jgi:hypothetical protein